MSSSDTSELLDRVPFVQSVVAGLAAWIASFVVIAILVAATEDGDDLVGFTGNVIYSSHFVESTIDVSTVLFTETRHENLLAEGYTELSELVYYAVPIVVLLAVGLLLVRALDIHDTEIAAIAGGATALGYVVLTVAGTYIFEFEQEITAQGQAIGEATITPELGLVTVVVMGLLYPIVFGAIGGVIGSRL